MALLEPTPTLSDLRQLPPLAVCEWAEALAKRGYDTAAAHESIDPRRAAWWYDTRCECATRKEAWRLLRQARAEAGTDSWRLECLESLRSLIGWQRYYAGLMPEPVPLWRFPAVP